MIVKKIIIIILANLAIGAFSQICFSTKGITGAGSGTPSADCFCMIAFAEPMSGDSDTVKLPDPAKPPPPIR